MDIVDIKRTDLKDLGFLYEQLSGKKHDSIKMLDNYDNMISNGQYYLIGAKIDNKLVGSLMGIKCFDLVGDCLPFMIIENVIVTESQRGMGIGKELFKRIEEIAIDNDCYYIFFVSGETRLEAHKFYESIGFTNDKVKGYKKYLKRPAPNRVGSR
jgi:GNAT superfamily N-acetyltransferase